MFFSATGGGQNTVKRKRILDLDLSSGHKLMMMLINKHFRHNNFINLLIFVVLFRFLLHFSAPKWPENSNNAPIAVYFMICPF